MSFHDPVALLLLLPISLIFAIFLRKKDSRRIRFSDVSLLQGLPVTTRQRLASSLPVLRAMAVVFAVVALARPQLLVRESTVTSRGIDLVLDFDISTSMLAVDRNVKSGGQSRLQIAKDIARDFISMRPGDRIGMVAFAARPYPVAPLTLDHDWLNRALNRLEVGAVEDGTALGDGLLSAINRLRSSPAASRTVLLVTDGRNNAGAVSPSVAAQASKALGIRIHTIGIGSQGPAFIPVQDPMGGITYREVHADLDVATLADIARITGGSFFRASDAAALRSVFKEIDRLERRPIEEKVTNSMQELFAPFLVAALVLLLVETTLKSTWLRRIP